MSNLEDVFVAFHEVDQMMQMVITKVITGQPPDRT